MRVWTGQRYEVSPARGGSSGGHGGSSRRSSRALHTPSTIRGRGCDGFNANIWIAPQGRREGFAGGVSVRATPPEEEGGYHGTVGGLRRGVGVCVWGGGGGWKEGWRGHRGRRLEGAAPG
ncbi:hypothetical protein D1007_37224 [Hordeum vulgare]|nr:hypothetical protein D1007_37224 [Hordeum vulgare]